MMDTFDACLNAEMMRLVSDRPNAQTIPTAGRSRSQRHEAKARARRKS